MNVDYKLIGSRIKAARKNANLTQEMLSEKLEVTTGYISQNIVTLLRCLSPRDRSIVLFLIKSMLDENK